MPSILISGENISLVQIVHPSIEIDLAYATPLNFTGRILYTEKRAYLRPEAAHALHEAAAFLADLSLRLVVLDAFRPVAVQKSLWAIRPDPEFVADPKIGSDHSRGIAVDVTLADATGRLDMGTDFDAAIPQSHLDRQDIPEVAVKNRSILREAMTVAGFDANPLEWWHYALTDRTSFPLIMDWRPEGTAFPDE